MTILSKEIDCFRRNIISFKGNAQEDGALPVDVFATGNTSIL